MLTHKELKARLIALKVRIEDSFVDEGDTVPGMDITLGVSLDPDSWAIQTGNNCYTGVAYGHPLWATERLYRRTNCAGMAHDLLQQIREQATELGHRGDADWGGGKAENFRN